MTPRAKAAPEVVEAPEAATRRRPYTRIPRDKNKHMWTALYHYVRVYTLIDEARQAHEDGGAAKARRLDAESDQMRQLADMEARAAGVEKPLMLRRVAYELFKLGAAAQGGEGPALVKAVSAQFEAVQEEA